MSACSGPTIKARLSVEMKKCEEGGVAVIWLLRETPMKGWERG